MTVTSTASPTDASTASDARDRKLEHIQLSLDARMQLDARYFDQLHFVHEALPEIDLDAIDTSTTFLGKPLRAPILISCMTGGTDRASAINRHLAEAAERTGVALGVGSQRKALEDPATAATF
ncbi:MAG: alpha-hydroxy-acid oxidizing protein [Acidobacteriota bacterium]